MNKNTIQAKWKGATLVWRYSSGFWHCSLPKKPNSQRKIKGLICRYSGHGETKDQAFYDFLYANGLQAWFAFLARSKVNTITNLNQSL